jgi:hypothetical protein
VSSTTHTPERRNQMNEPYWIQLASASASLLLTYLAIRLWVFVTIDVDEWLYQRKKRKRMEGSK